jgi:hypothetical protein
MTLVIPPPPELVEASNPGEGGAGRGEKN